MADTTISTFDPALKQIYKDQNVENLAILKRPLLGLLTKSEDFGGRNMPIVWQYANTQGRSAKIGAAAANASALGLEDALLTRGNLYQVGYITSETIEATRGDTMAFLKALKQKIDSIVNALSDALETHLFRDGSGSIGQGKATAPAATGQATTVVALTQIGEAINFEVGMRLSAAATLTGAIRHATNTATLVAVDRSLGYLYIAAAATDWVTANGYNDGDYLFVFGEAQNTATAALVPTGLQGWLPTSTQIATERAAVSQFFSCYRYLDSRLAGLYLDGSGDTLEDTVIDAQSSVGEQNGKADLGIIHHRQMRKLIKELGAKKVYNQVMGQSSKGGEARIGYRGVVIDGDEGEINVVAANKCPPAELFMLSQKYLKLAALGAPTKFLDDDDNRILRVAIAASDSDARYEIRMVSRCNLYTTAPIWNARVALANP